MDGRWTNPPARDPNTGHITGNYLITVGDCEIAIPLDIHPGPFWRRTRFRRSVQFKRCRIHMNDELQDCMRRAINAAEADQRDAVSRHALSEAAAYSLYWTCALWANANVPGQIACGAALAVAVEAARDAYESAKKEICEDLVRDLRQCMQGHILAGKPVWAIICTPR